MMMVKASVKAIERLRHMAERVKDDFRLMVRLLAVVAIVTKDEQDVSKAVAAAKEHVFNNDQIAEALAIIVNTLARSRKFDEARRVVHEMSGMNHFWLSEALISIVRYSGLNSDVKAASEAILDVRSSRLRDDARHDLALAQKDHHIISAKNGQPDVAELNAVLSGLEALEDAHWVGSQQSSAKLRLTAKAIVDRIFADSL